MRYLIISLSLVALFGCGKKNTDQAPPAVREFVQDFNKGRNTRLQDFGVSSVQTNEQNIKNTDCMVFDQAAKNPLPNNLGESSAYQESMRLRALLGCGANILEPLTKYESARRNTLRLWNGSLVDKVPSVQMVIKSTPAGKSVDAQTKDVLSEQLACRAEQAFEVRKNTKSTLTLERSLRRCPPDIFSSSNQEEVCRHSWYTAEGQKQAGGARDIPSYMSELGGRYHLMFMQCTPNASMDYAAFHKTVPREIFNGLAYRFRVPIDPIMACHTKEMSERRAKKTTPRAMHSYAACARKFNLEYLVSHSKMPTMFTPAMLDGGEPYKWIYDPSRGVNEPLRWSFGVCEKTLIGYLQKYQFNIVEPEGLRNYCNSQAHK